MSYSSLHHNKSTSLLTKGVDDIIEGVERDKKYDIEASYSKCCLRLLNEKNGDWPQLLQVEIRDKFS
jgi:hypothetical protein